MDKANKAKPKKDKRWWLGATISFFLPFVCIGLWVEHWAYLDGQKDVNRWSHLVESTPQPLAEHLLASAIWFVGGGLIAGLAGLLLFYLFTCYRSS